MNVRLLKRSSPPATVRLLPLTRPLRKLRQKAATLRDIGGFELAIGALGGIRSEAAAASYAEDKRRIDAAILAAGGFERIDQSHTQCSCTPRAFFSAPHPPVRSVLRAPLVRLRAHQCGIVDALSCCAESL